ncbi:MAG: hypothetical protein WDN23_07125 [Edaphobacter sp.]
MKVFLWRMSGALVVVCVVSGGAGAQTAKAKPGMAVWSPEVQQTLGVTQENFNAEGLNKLTKMQLIALETSARIDPKKGLLSCPVSGVVPGGRIRVLVTVDGDDSTGALAGQIRQAVAGLNGVDVVTTAAQADKALHVVIQEQTTARRTIGFTASYVTATPCVMEKNGKKTDVELKGTLGTSTANAKGDGLAQNLASMLDQDLKSLSAGSH